MEALLDSFREMSITDAVAWSLGTNVAIFVVSVLFGEVLVRAFRDRPCSPTAAPLSRQEVLFSAGCVLLNSLVMVIGVVLFQRGAIHVHASVPLWRVVVDVLVLLLVMDVAMYVLHRIAHVPVIYSIVHRTHHTYENPRPLSLFVLNPFEVLGFAGLWLLVICVYASSAAGMIIYLFLNVVFGTIGHLGVEPLPTNWTKGPIWWLGTSTFHARHHNQPRTNFGFYTLFWDYLFGTLDSEPYREVIEEPLHHSE